MTDRNRNFGVPRRPPVHLTPEQTHLIYPYNDSPGPRVPPRLCPAWGVWLVMALLVAGAALAAYLGAG